MGVRRFGIQWDDLFEGGPVVGRRHGEGVARIRDGLGVDARWVSAPDDYALSRPSEYLLAFAAALPADVTLIWTGPSVLSSDVTLAEMLAFEEGLGRRVVFAENFPVNDLAMSDVLHLGPYPRRDPRLVAHLDEVYVNFMERPLASRIGLGVASAFWKETTHDRDEAWHRVVGEVPGLEPIALACRSWMDDPDPHPRLLALLDLAAGGGPGLREHLASGCRDGLAPAWQAELSPWLAQWEAEAHAMSLGLDVLEALGAGGASVREVWRSALGVAAGALVTAAGLRHPDGAVPGDAPRRRTHGRRP